VIITNLIFNQSNDLGIVGRLEDYLNAFGARLDDKEDDSNEDSEKDGQDNKDRLQSLATFQKTIVLHTMKCTLLVNSMFSVYLTQSFLVPSVKRVVYSTCSIHREENEDVVMEVCSLQVS